MGISAGAAKVEITPPIHTPLPGLFLRKDDWDSVADPVYARALALDDGRTKVALVVGDLLWLDREFAERVRGLIEQRTGIPPDRVMVAATQTHFGPILERPYYPVGAEREALNRGYVAEAARGFAEAVARADAALRPARIGWGFGSAPELVYNRRGKRPDGSIQMLMGKTPTPEEMGKLTMGPTDPRLGVLRVDGEDGRPISALLNYACHPVCGHDLPHAVSADYPGAAVRGVEEARGGVGIFALGCAGNVVPIFRGVAGRERTGAALAAEAVRVLEKTPTSSTAALGAERTVIQLPKRSSPTPEEARVWLAREEAAHGQVALARLVAGLVEAVADRATVPFEVQIFRAGGLRLVGLPSDVFVEIGLAIQRRFPDSFVLNFCNGFVGYVAPAAAFDEGGYEPTVTNLAKGSGEKVIEAAIRLCE